MSHIDEPINFPIHPVGINFGPDEITVAGLDDNGLAYHITRLTGHTYYKSYMRQDLWQDAVDWPGQLESRIPHKQAQHLLQEARPGTLSQLKPILKQVESQLRKKLGRKPIISVIGVPIYSSSQRRRELRSAISALDLDITVLATVRQGPLAARFFGFLDGDARGQEHTILTVEYNHASLDVALATTEQGTIDVLGHTSWPFLGEDYLTLKLASLSIEQSNSRSQHRALRNRALLIREQREDLSYSQIIGANESLAVESAHFEAITHKLVLMIDKQTYPDDATRSGKPWKPLSNDVSHILMAGDANDRGFRSLRKALVNNSRLSRLRDAGYDADATTAAWISAEGAAKGVKARQYEEEDGSRNWISHQEL